LFVFTLAEVGQKIHKSIKSMCDILMQSENLLNKLDTEGGDGDCGTTHRRGAEGKEEDRTDLVCSVIY
jgi:hypothetical protein